MALVLARRHQRFPSNPSLIRFFSNSSSDPPPKIVNASTEKPSQSPSPSPSDVSNSSPFTDIKTTLRQKLQQQQEQGRNPFPRSDSQSQNRGSSRFSDNQSRGSIQDLGLNLAKFQRRSTVPPSSGSSGSQSRPQISLEALYKQNVAPNSADPRNRKAPELDLNSVRNTLQNLKNQSSMDKSGMFLRSFKGTLKTMSQGDEALPKSVFGKEIDGKEEREGETEEMMTEFLTFYNEEQLGEKLRSLRPEGNKEEGWFSLQELNQRLVKLRQAEEKEVQARTGNTVLRNVISKMRIDATKNEQQNLNFMNYFETPEYKLHPPKEDLVETYFHPDNLSSAEKMKIELTKVREEFKMSESDCGSARVQVAQLTTKIKHLSSSLHKKDKHSRKGLLGMVQKRKKLLKYLRRTDWDSYCLVLSKLSLRDNPDYKF
ncbi:unnamed protein product [Arabis nemorensis]|uniref:Small ribosomal subunit protein uS15c n=1 Tax=Arabis nemorensis TaxID=586526 RepID=A0A565AS68_9BRAS|nr:unnamed protein product [Arabis nemorensis]